MSIIDAVRNTAEKEQSDELKELVHLVSEHHYRDAWSHYRSMDTWFRDAVPEEVFKTLRWAREKNHHEWDVDRVWRALRRLEIEERMKNLDEERAALAAELSQLGDTAEEGCLT